MPLFEFHINREVRKVYGLDKTLFAISGNVILLDMQKTREFALAVNQRIGEAHAPSEPIKASSLYIMALIDEILHYITGLYRKAVGDDVFGSALSVITQSLGDAKSERLLNYFSDEFPPQLVYAGNATVPAYLSSSHTDAGVTLPGTSIALEEVMHLSLSNLNPAFNPFRFMFSDDGISAATSYESALSCLKNYLALLPPFGPDGQNLWDILRSPALASDTLEGQLRFMMEKWKDYLAPFMARILTSLDVLREENKPNWGGAPGPTEIYTYGALDAEYERFSTDLEWMPRCVLMAKCTLVWLDQLSKKYKREIRRLNEVPDEEIETLARRGFTGLWLIGLWERSEASRTIKQWKGNAEAAASAYSLYDYDIASELGGWDALLDLKKRCARHGIRLASDMVPNHTGLDSKWIVEHPDRFLQLDRPPFPQYAFNSGDLSRNGDIVLQIEDRYYNNSDCAVVFHHYDKRNGRHRYIYHGNDGTSMPWNDTAQIDFLNPEAREAVIQTIIGVCKMFPIVRFDAAMTLAKRHIQRLWYPEPGRGGDIASRAEHAISRDEFNKRIPNEFWREVVDRCASEAPGTLLLAEAFWMMEGYFVRTLGMHRVYNSAFMNMLKKEENFEYRSTIKNTLAFDSEVLQRFVNFMNNPDEETAVAQFGKGDKYFGICTLLVTMPGLPMFGHGQIDGFEEKYGMEYRRAYWDETSDAGFVERHEREIFPLMKKRHVFSGASDFFLYDFYNNGAVNENVFAYTNRAGDERALVLYNNSYQSAAGWVKNSPVDVPQKQGGTRRLSVAQALSLHFDGDYFVLLRERSGLWFIRSSKALHEEGLFAMLGGYEAQVYLDIHEVAGAGWARLHHELGGRGVQNPAEAMEDLSYGGLYAAFSAAWSALETGADNAPLALEAFVSEAGKYAAEDGYKIKKATVQKKVAKKDAPTKKSAPLSSASVFYTLIAAVRDALDSKTAGEAAASLVRVWNLQRKHRELCAVKGGSTQDAAFEAEAALYFLAAFDGGGVKKSPTKTASAKAAKAPASKPAKTPLTAYSIIADNLESGAFKALLGINLFENTLWYNAERMQASLTLAALFAEAEGAGVKARALIKEIAAADKKADYKVEKLLAGLEKVGKTADKA